MVGQVIHNDYELAAIAKSSAAILELPDGEARRRVLTYVMDRYLPGPGSGRLSAAVSQPASVTISGTRARDSRKVICWAWPASTMTVASRSSFVNFGLVAVWT